MKGQTLWQDSGASFICSVCRVQRVPSTTDGQTQGPESHVRGAHRSACKGEELPRTAAGGQNVLGPHLGAHRTRTSSAWSAQGELPVMMMHMCYGDAHREPGELGGPAPRQKPSQTQRTAIGARSVLQTALPPQASHNRTRTDST